MRNQTIILFLAVIFYNGFFACNTSGENGSVKKDTLKPGIDSLVINKPFDCAKDSLVPLGFIDSGWVFRNAGLGISFRYPTGWNAIDDIHMANPSFVPVGGNLKVFRKQYRSPRTSRLEIMKKDGWEDPRFLFGITRLDEPPYDENYNPLYDESVYAAAYLFYSDHLTESHLYKDIFDKSREQWKLEENATMFSLNKTTMSHFVKERIGSDTFYTQVIRMPVTNGIMNVATSIRKKGCLFLMLVFHWYREKEHRELVKAMEGLQLSNQ